MDNVADFTQTPHKIAHQIYKANKQLIDECDIVIANLNPFRGKEPDSGTVWECGYATGSGKRVYGYIQDDKEYIEQFGGHEKGKLQENDTVSVDNDGMMIEDFKHPFNLMIACSVDSITIGEFEDVLKSLKTV